MELRVFVEPQEGFTYEDQLAAALAAERLGYGAFFRSDHLLAIGTGEPLPGPTDSWVSLGGIARETKSIRLGTLVSSATFREPGLLAVQVAQVDEMSRGRVELGLGAGWYEAEHAAYGIPFPDRRARFERLEEQLEIISGIWGTAAGDRFTHEGRHYVLRDCPALPRPVQGEGPPLIVGGVGPRRTPALAARFASELNVFGDPELCAAQYGRVSDACEAIGRDPATIVRSAAVRIACAQDRDLLERRLAPLGGEAETLRDQGAAIGSPAEVLETLGRYRDAGAARTYLQFMDMTDLDHIELVAAEVMPHVA